MAPGIQVYGPAKISIDAAELGYTRNGADVRSRGYFVDVPGDENGGEQGPPIDIQFMGEVANVRLELTKYDATVADTVLARLKGGAAGVPGAAGTLMFGGNKEFSLVITGATQTMTFARAILRGDWELNKGTRYSMLVLEFECHKDANGKIYTVGAVG
jgi:hypothetical protein